MLTRRRLLAAVLAGAATTSLTACGTSSTGPTALAAAAPGVLDVVAAEDPWGDLARQVGGDRVRVTSILTDPGADPHTYEVDPRAAAALSTARLVVVNGAGYDDFATKLLASAGHDRARTVLEVAAVAGRSGDGVNPHLWYDPDAVRRTAAALTAALSRLQPAHAGEFAANERAFLAAYQPYLDAVAAIRAAHAGARVGYTERVAGYLVAAAGLRLGTPAGFSRAVEDGDDPSPADTARFDRALTSRSVRALLVNRQVVSAPTTALAALATSSGVPVVGVTETLPEGEDLQTWQLRQARALAAALERTRG